MATVGDRWRSADILIVGAGVLGVSVAYWLSTMYDCRIVLVDKERLAGFHTSSRNTGIIHRPFYLNPRSKKVFARSSVLSYPMWRGLALAFGLPWKPIGTLNVATNEAQVHALDQYLTWADENGMERGELEYLDGRQVSALEPEVKSRAAILSKPDVSVDFGAFTRSLLSLAVRNGVVFIGGLTLTGAPTEGDMVAARFRPNDSLDGIRCRFMINAAGGAALEIAQLRGLARGYASLCFRGDYWMVNEPLASKVGRSVYTPPRHPKFPFLDPHFVVRADGSRQVGPGATLVTGPYVYTGAGLREAKRFLSSPLAPKLRLARDPEFLSLVATEWQSSLSRGEMCDRVKRFIPNLEAGMLGSRGVSGVRTSIVDRNGFVPEALIERDSHSLHILNYNSPGATGAPAYSAMVLSQLRADGLLDPFTPGKVPASVMGWDFEVVADG